MQLYTFSEKIGLQLKETLREQKFSRDKTKNKGLNISIWLTVAHGSVIGVVMTSETGLSVLFKYIVVVFVCSAVRKIE